MALRYIDGFDSYSSADLLLSYPTGVTGATIFSPGRFGSASTYPFFGLIGFQGSCLSLSNGNVISTLLGNQVQMIAGFSFKCTSIPSTGSPLFFFGEAGVAWKATLRLNPNGTLVIRSNGVDVTGGTSLWAMHPGVWYYIEFKFYVSASIPANSCQVNVDDSNVINCPVGTNTLTGSAYNNVFMMYNGAAPPFYFDDLYVADSAAGQVTDFLGPQEVNTRVPRTASLFNDAATWSLGAGWSDWGAVNEQNQDGDTSFIYSNTVGEFERFAIPPSFAPAERINGVQTRHVSAAGDASLRQTCDILGDGLSYREGQTVTLTNGIYKNYPHLMETDPFTGTAWTLDKASTLEPGVKVIA